ncbi:hypothetical protein Tco_0185437, partial [Tanacetum coccineum]
GLESVSIRRIQCIGYGISGFLGAWIRAETKAKLKESRTPLVGFSGEVSYPIWTITLRVTMGESERLRTIPMDFAVVKSHSLYNVILGQTGLRNLGAVAFTIHSMIKFLTANGIATMTTKRETLQECQRIKEARGPAMEGSITFPRIQAPESEGTTNKGREESRGQTDKVGEPDSTIQPSHIPSKKDTQTDEKDKGKDQPLEKSLESKPLENVAIHDNYPEQTIIIEGNLSVETRAQDIPSHKAESAEKMEKNFGQKKVVKDEVAEWLKAEIVRKVRYPTWVANLVLVKKTREWTLLALFLRLWEKSST